MRLLVILKPYTYVFTYINNLSMVSFPGITLGIQTLMKSNAQLRHEGQGDVPQPPPILVDTSVATSSS
jgi:hypothetical protein